MQMTNEIINASTPLGTGISLSGGRYNVDPRIADVLLAQIGIYAADKPRALDRCADRVERILKQLPEDQLLMLAFMSSAMIRRVNRRLPKDRRLPR